MSPEREQKMSSISTQIACWTIATSQRSMLAIRRRTGLNRVMEDSAWYNLGEEEAARVTSGTGAAPTKRDRWSRY